MIDILINTLFTGVILLGVVGGLFFGIESIINKFPNVKEKISNMFGD